jgi:hypothetical protein
MQICIKHSYGALDCGGVFYLRSETGSVEFSAAKIHRLNIIYSKYRQPMVGYPHALFL